MTWTTRIRTWMRSVAGRERLEQEMQEELRFHIESYAEDLQRKGLARDEALRTARVEFGGIEAKKEECRASLGLRIWDELCSNVRYALRALRKSPGFTSVAILTLALGIGANAAIFTLMDAMLLRTVAVHDAKDLLQVRMEKDTVFTNPLWEAIRERQDVFDGIATWGNTQFNLANGGATQLAQGIWVSGDYFRTLQVQPALGRLITAEDDHRSCPAIAVLSYSFWQQHYSGSTSVVGSTISLDSHPFEIVGVAARGFYGMVVGSKFDVATPICSTAYEDGARSRLDVRSWWWLTIVGRKKPELSIDQVNARLTAIAPAVYAASVPQNWDLEGQQRFKRGQLLTQPAASGISYLRKQFQQPLKVLMAVVGVVLLIACANIASLMLARAASQEKEIAVRMALGASRMRLVRQLLTHALLLSVGGAVAGVAVARWATALLVTMISTRQDKVFLDVSPDWRVLAFTIGVAIATGATLAVLPALRSRAIPLTNAMHGAASNQSQRHSPVRKWIVAGQIALSMVLLVTAGLFLRSFAKLVSLDPGFDRENVLLVTANLRTTNLKTDQHLATFDAIEARLATLPGVTAVGRAHITPLSNTSWDDSYEPDIPNPPTGNQALTMVDFISPGYFDAMRMHLLSGRNFANTDGKSAPLVAIVNETFIRKVMRSVDPIGHYLRNEKSDGKLGDPILIVGTVADSKYQSLRQENPPTVFFPIAQVPEPEYQDTFVMRAAVPVNSLRSSAEAAIASISHEIPVSFTTLSEQVNDTIVQDRVLAMLSGFFGGVALLLAMIGLYGAVSYRVTLRRTEFGIRMALGAKVSSIIGLVVGEVVLIVSVGVAAGAAISLAATTTLQKLLFGLGSHDFVTLGGAALVLAGVAMLAAFAPARRAARVDPMVALRYE